MGSGNRPPTSVSISPKGIALDSAGDLFIADSANYRIREIIAPEPRPDRDHPVGLDAAVDRVLRSDDDTDVYTRTLTSSDTGVTVDYSASSPKVASLAVYRGVEHLGPIDVSSVGSTSSGTSVAASSVTTTDPGDELVFIGGASGQSGPRRPGPPRAGSASSDRHEHLGRLRRRRRRRRDRSRPVPRDRPRPRPPRRASSPPSLLGPRRPERSPPPPPTTPTTSRRSSPTPTAMRRSPVTTATATSPRPFHRSASPPTRSPRRRVRRATRPTTGTVSPPMPRPYAYDALGDKTTVTTPAPAGLSGSRDDHLRLRPRRSAHLGHRTADEHVGGRAGRRHGLHLRRRRRAPDDDHRVRDRHRGDDELLL